MVAEEINYGIIKIPNLYLRLGKCERDEIEQIREIVSRPKVW